jgi:hypothetical protein
MPKGMNRNGPNWDGPNNPLDKLPTNNGFNGLVLFLGTILMDLETNWNKKDKEEG